MASVSVGQGIREGERKGSGERDGERERYRQKENYSPTPVLFGWSLNVLVSN